MKARNRIFAAGLLAGAGALAAQPVVLKGQAAGQLMATLQKAGALERTPDPCHTGSCKAAAALGIACEYPNGPNPQHAYDCALNPVTGTSRGTVAHLSGAEAHGLMRIADRAGAVEHDESPCGFGRCFEAARIEVACQYPAGPGAIDLHTCTVTAARPDANP